MKIELDFREIGNKIQEVRNQKRLTQEQLAEMVGTSQKHISRIEVGYHNVKLDTLVAIARALCVSVDALIADSNNSEDESTLKVIVDEIRGMKPKQLEMLRENIQTIKKYE